MSMNNNVNQSINSNIIEQPPILPLIAMNNNQMMPQFDNEQNNNIIVDVHICIFDNEL